MWINAARYARRSREVNRLMSLEPQALEPFRLARLREMVAYAYENVELYRRKWRRAGVRPDHIETLADLKKLPVTTRDDFRHNFPDAILSQEFRARDCYVVGTSGSTGSPVKLYLNLDRALVDFALSLPKHMAGRRPVTVSSVVRDFFWRWNITYMAIVVDKPSAYESLYGRVIWAMEHTVVNSLEPPEAHIKAINEKRPKYIYSYPSVIRNICITAKEKGIRMFRPDLIMVCGEALDGHLRGLVTQTFGCELLGVYGTTEFGFIACECVRHEGMHIFDWKILLELLDDAGREVLAGQSGQVVVTDLFNKATPIIRYNGLGDYAVRKQTPCSCGMRLPLLARIDGRRVDSIVLPDGQLIHPYSLTLALEDVPYLSKFQIRQEQPDHIRVLLVRDKLDEAANVSLRSDSQIGRSITRRFDRILKSQVRVELVTVDDIPKRPGAHKYATVVSAVKRD
jgi:phenylacetate-CoA ligase